MRVKYLVCLFLFLILVFIVVNLIKRRKGFFNTVLVLLLLVLFFVIGNAVNLNMLARERQKKIDEVIEVVGSTYIKAESGSVYIKVNGDWLNLDDIAIVGDFTRDVVIEYEGEKIYLGHSGVYNTIKVLQDVGLIKE